MHLFHVTESLSSVISVCWATVDWTWSKEWNWCAQTDLHLNKKKKKKKVRWGMIHQTSLPDPCVLGKNHHHHLHSTKSDIYLCSLVRCVTHTAVAATLWNRHCSCWPVSATPFPTWNPFWPALKITPCWRMKVSTTAHQCLSVCVSLCAEQ